MRSRGQLNENFDNNEQSRPRFISLSLTPLFTSEVHCLHYDASIGMLALLSLFCEHLCKEAPVLVLTRKVNESIQIGDGIRVTIVRIGPGAVRIGVEAPPHISVLRGELIEAEAATQARESVLSH